MSRCDGGDFGDRMGCRDGESDAGRHEGAGVRIGDRKPQNARELPYGSSARRKLKSAIVTSMVCGDICRPITQLVKSAKRHNI